MLQATARQVVAASGQQGPWSEVAQSLQEAVRLALQVVGLLGRQGRLQGLLGAVWGRQTASQA